MNKRTEHEQKVKDLCDRIEELKANGTIGKGQPLDVCMRDRCIYTYHYEKKIIDLEKYGLTHVPMELYKKYNIYASICNDCFEIITRQRF